LIAREIDDVESRRYYFFNHCCPRGVRPALSQKAVA